ncbi:N-acetylmuramoyl-L-alanine amidase [Desulfolucanica intricata]|uniref:N-acetylmuramoyl-L-alanine amidase n=1 Tax=Desulfolucanica intricata TaxID=1285191 RepID=UPI00083255E2|nr:N-acetylmuramoyl-L-alanine amidase [Desulfolucanica intricata]
MKIVIDPGHGGADPGSVGNGLREKDLNLTVALRVNNLLKNYDVDVMLTRSGDQEVSLYERAAFANRNNADYFVSVHTNAGGGTGFESFIHTNAFDRTEKLRAIIHKQVADYYLVNGFPDRGKKQANFAVLRETNMPAVLLENLFIDNEKDAAALKDKKFLDGLADAIVQGLVSALNLKKRPVTSKTPIMGEARADREQARAYIARENEEYAGIVDIYYDLAPIYGIRPEVAIAQAAKETAFFHFGGDVSPSQNNFAGIGATGGGKSGASFSTRERGVEAHLQHLYAYASTNPLPAGRVLIDPRFNLVNRGSAPSVEDLGGKWAPSMDYGQSIVEDYLNKLISTKVSEPPQQGDSSLEERVKALEKKVKELEQLIKSNM